MAGIIPALYVPPPPAGPLRYGLFTAARGPLELPEHARAGGVEFEPDTCGIAYPYTAECPPSAQDAKTIDDDPDSMTAAPFIVYASLVCAPVGRDAGEHERRAIAKLMTGEQTVVEDALWDGAGVGASPTLTGAGATVVAPAETGFAARIAALEEVFYSAYGYQGTIHVNTAAAGAAALNNLIVRDGSDPRRFTPLGSIWSFGAGYDITGPADVAPAAGSVFAFMTGPVTIWRSTEVFVAPPSQTFDRTANQMYAIAEREYAQAWDCSAVFAIEVPLETAP